MVSGFLVPGCSRSLLTRHPPDHWCPWVDLSVARGIPAGRCLADGCDLRRARPRCPVTGMSAVVASVRRSLFARSTWKGADMASIAPMRPVVIGGVDTHKNLHVAAVVDVDDRVLDTAAFPTTRSGYRALLMWMRGFGQVQRVGVEGTGCYGAALHRYLAGQGVQVLEVARPERSDRRRRGKDDTLDACNAAHAARSGQRVVAPKAHDGMVEALWVLRAGRTTAVSARREALQVLDAQVIAAPQELRDQVRA